MSKQSFSTFITGYRSHLREPKILKFSWGACPQTPLECTGMLCTLQIFQSPPPPPPPNLKKLSTPMYTIYIHVGGVGPGFN